MPFWSKEARNDPPKLSNTESQAPIKKPKPDRESTQTSRLPSEQYDQSSARAGELANPQPAKGAIRQRKGPTEDPPKQLSSRRGYTSLSTEAVQAPVRTTPVLLLVEDFPKKLQSRRGYTTLSTEAAQAPVGTTPVSLLALEGPPKKLSLRRGYTPLSTEAAQAPIRTTPVESLLAGPTEDPPKKLPSRHGHPTLSTGAARRATVGTSSFSYLAGTQNDRQKAPVPGAREGTVGNIGEGGDSMPPGAVRSEKRDLNTQPSTPRRRLPQSSTPRLNTLNPLPAVGVKPQGQAQAEMDRDAKLSDGKSNDDDDSDMYEDAREFEGKERQQEANRQMYLQQQQLLEVAQQAMVPKLHGSRSSSAVLGIGAGTNSDKPRTSQEKSLRKKLAETEVALQQSQSSSANRDHHFRKLWTRANAQGEELQRSQHEVHRLTAELEAVKLQLTGARTLTEVRGKELKGGQVLAKADALSATDVVQNANEGAWDTSGESDILSTAAAIQKVDVLNVEVCRVAAVLGKMLQKVGFREGAHREIAQIPEKARVMLGKNIAALLSAALLHRANLKPLLVQVLLQVAITNWCKTTISSWKPGNSDASNLLSELYSKIREAEDPTFSCRWRSVTRAQLQFSSDNWSRDLLDGLLSILAFAGWSTLNPNQRGLLEEQFPPIFNAIVDLRKALGEDITSFDLEVAAVDSGTIFNSISMDNGWPASTRENTPEIVSGTTGLGLKKVVMKPSTQGLILKADIIYRPRIILEYTLKEALIPPSLRPQPHNKGVLARGTASADGRD